MRERFAAGNRYDDVAGARRSAAAFGDDARVVAPFGGGKNCVAARARHLYRRSAVRGLEALGIQQRQTRPRPIGDDNYAFVTRAAAPLFIFPRIDRMR